MTDFDAAPTLQLSDFFRETARRLVADEPLAQVLAWAAEHGNDLIDWPEQEGRGTAGPGFSNEPPEQRRFRQSRMTRNLAWQMARFLPLPQRQFKPMTLTFPGRNDPCLCGSLKKYKSCCSALASSMPVFTSESLAPYLFLAMPQESWASLPGKVPAVWVLGAVGGWLRLHTSSAENPLSVASDEDLKSALALLKPWTELEAPWPNKHVTLYDLLGDIYLELDMASEREMLAHLMIQRGEKVVQALGWERLALMAFDNDEMDEAFDALHHTQRLDPNNPRTAFLELTLLHSRGDMVLAQERAAWHARRLARLPSTPELEHIVEVLERASKEGMGVLYKGFQGAR